MRLGQWLGAQRRTKETTMTEDHNRKLQLLVDTGKLKWHMKIVHSSDWERNYGLLLDYGSVNGTYNVPAGWRVILADGDVVNLGMWLITQRRTKDTIMTEEHKEMLQILVNTGKLLWRMADRWDICYAGLLEYGSREGHYNVPVSWKHTLTSGPHAGEEVNLGAWLKTQRKTRNTTLTEDRRILLQRLVDMGKLRWNMREK